MAEPPAKKSRKEVLTASERQARERERGKRRAGTRIGLGKAFERWRSLKAEQGFETDEAVAEFLLDCWHNQSKGSLGTCRTLECSEDPVATTTRMQTCSTPVSTPYSQTGETTQSASEISTQSASEISTQSASEISTQSASEISTQSASEISTQSASEISTQSASEISTQSASEISTQSASEISEVECERSSITKRTSRGRLISKTQFPDCFMDPFNLSIEESEELFSGDEDEDYEPTFCLPDNIQEDMTEGEASDEMDMDFETDEDEMLEEIEEIQTHVVSSKDECTDIVHSEKCMVFVDQLLALGSCIKFTCSKCAEPVTMTHSFLGSAVHIKWICVQNHKVYHWCSQPLLNRRVHAGDFLLSASILTSGNNCAKMLLWANELNLRFPSERQFYNIQRCYVVPAIDTTWKEHLSEVRQQFQDKDIILMGDGRNDSPGHCAQYCSYTFMEYHTKQIVALTTVDKRQTDRKSVNMEKKGFIEAISDVTDSGLNITEIVTDAHIGIASLMRKQYPDVLHSYDIWHVAKNLGKKIVKAAQKKQNSILLQWTRDIINHFWFSCQKAENYSEFVGIWRSILHHITNKHEWIVPHGGGLLHCLHEDINEETRTKPWLHPVNHSHILKDLTGIVLDKRLLKNVQHFLNCRSTGHLEGFNQHILMYCSKRFAYTPPIYRARNLLAAMDHNMNADRGIQKNKDGSTRYHRSYNKKSGRWSVHACRVPKTYSFVDDILVKALHNRLEDSTGMYQPVTLDATDARLISKSLAPIEPPSTKQLVQEKQSRFS